MVVSWESTSWTWVLPLTVPWLHTLTEAVKGSPCAMLGGPLTAWMM
jgi:hypothetical protein